jgi:hypothetical protein
MSGKWEFRIRLVGELRFEVANFAVRGLVVKISFRHAETFSHV